jgi:hypothetical protein
VLADLEKKVNDAEKGVGQRPKTLGSGSKSTEEKRGRFWLRKLIEFFLLTCWNTIVKTAAGMNTYRLNRSA